MSINSNKTDIINYWWIFGIMLALALVSFILSETVWTKYKWIGNAISLVGTFASLAGIVLALKQIQQADTQIYQAKEQIDAVSKTTEATEKAVLANKDEINRFLSFAEMGHLVESIKNTQNYIRKKDMNSAVILMQQIKDNMLRVNSEYDVLLNDNNINLENHISSINLDIRAIVDDQLKVRKGSNDSSMLPNEIHHNLENTRDEIIRIETIIKKQTL